ncbi:MAG: DUF5615 family PIN-like protein [Chloroflexi bacterium]|nr:DUF5615 family PIN-like protein [Chloroflexota bacterium]
MDKETVDILRLDGHDVIYVVELGQRIPDTAILDMAVEQDAILITNDLDFGEMVFLQRRKTYGILLTRVPELSPQQRAEVIAAVIRQYSDELPGKFAVLTSVGLRIRSTGL